MPQNSDARGRTLSDSDAPGPRDDRARRSAVTAQVTDWSPFCGDERSDRVRRCPTASDALLRKSLLLTDFGRLGGTGATGLEPATSGVTGRRSNQLSYAPGSATQYGKAR